MNINKKKLLVLFLTLVLCQFQLSTLKAEEVKSIDDIKHPIVRETLKEFNYDRGLDISYIGDLPGGSGMGSSSAFTAALVKSIYNDMKKDICGNSTQKQE